MPDSLSFDPRDPYIPLDGGDGIRWAVQVFTTSNGYGLDGVDRADDPGHHHRFGFAQLGQQRRVEAGEATVRVDRGGDAWVFRIEASHAEPIKSVKLILRGLPADELEQGWWSATTPRGTTQHPPLQWTYPGPAWATRWAAAGAVSLSVRSDRVSGAVLHVASPPYGEGTEVEVVHAVPASEWSTRVSVPPIRLAIGTDASAAERELDEHVRTMREGFGIPRWEERADLPAWARDLDLVVTLHGQHWTGHVFHTFADMTRLLTELADDVDPTRVLVYLPGWEGRYYFAYPDYAPGDDLGGEAGFASLIESAHALGYRVMPMFGANGANVGNYPAWEDAAIRNPSNRYPVMLNSPDWDGDRYPEGDQVFLNPGEPRFREHLVEAVSRTVERYGVDAAFFDTASFWFDDPRYPLYDGYRALTTELRTRHPELLLVSEGWWDAMTALFPMSQQWLGIERDIRAPGLVADVARTTAHLADGTPGTGSTGVHEEGFRTPDAAPRIAGHLPVIAYAGGDGSAQREAARRLRADARGGW